MVTRALIPVAVMVAALVVAAVMEAAAAATYTVGAPDGLWDMQTDYAQWVKTKTFHPGDTITFMYSAQLHDVVEVTKAAYDACSSANNISAFSTGNDVVPLTAVGSRYFLCGLTGHCDSGMKIRIDVVAVGSAPGPAAAGPSSSAAALPSPWPASSAGIAAVAVGTAAALLQLQHAAITRPLW